MSDVNEDIPMAECGSCRAIVPVDSSACPECGISFSGVSDEALGECGACNALVPLDSTKCPECGVVFVADDVVDVLRTWMANNKMDVKTLFGRFDTNDDNMIDSGELRDGLLSLNLADLPPSQVDRLVEAIDQDGDSLIDLKELQSIIGGEELDDSIIEEDSEGETSLEYNEIVLGKVMASSGIDESDKEAFLAFAQDFNADDNSYLKKEELQAAAESWNEKSEEVEDVAQADEEEDGEDDNSQTVSDEEVDEVTDESEDDEMVEELEDEPVGEEVLEADEDSDDEVGEEEFVDEAQQDEEYGDGYVQEDHEDAEATVVRSHTEIMEQLLDIIDEQDKSLANAFGDLDDDGNRMLSAEEVLTKLNEILPDGLSQEEANNFLKSMDTDGDGNIDMIEFVNAVERHEDEIVTIEDEEAETLKTFPSELQTRFMSKKWHDVFWPLIHTSFAIIIVGLLVNAFIPIVDGTGGMVELDIREDSFQTEWQLDDGTVVSEGDAYPCDPEIQEGECKNSLTPLSGEASSMPGGLYPDAIVALILAGCGIIWSLYTHLILAPSWRARVKAMKDVDDERAEVKEAIDEEDSEEETEVDNSEEETEDVTEEEEVEEAEDEDDEFDIGSFVGLEIDGEDYYGTIIEFDDDEGTVVIEEDETGDEIVGYQDEMFIPED